MKKINLYKIFAILFIAISVSCVDNNDFELPTIGVDKEYANLKSLDQIIAQYNGDVVEFNDDITISGYVISDDREGNFYKTLVIQDKPENPTVGVEIKIDDANLGARYNVGRKVYVKLKGLALSKPYSAFEIGIKGTGNRTDRIGAEDYVSKIDRSTEIVDIVPTTLTIGDLTDNHINTLVKIEGLQSATEGLQYAYPEDDSYITRTMTSCETFEKIDISTSKFVSFKEYPIPDKKGSITAILDEFSGSYQLVLRDTNDVNFTEEYGCDGDAVEKTLADIKALYNGTETTIKENLKIKVVITSDLAAGNIHGLSAFAQDASAGIALRFSDDHNLNLGDEVEIAVGGARLSEFNDLLQLNIAPSSIINKTTGTLPTPEVITFAQALTGDYESKLVQIDGLQFKDNTKTYSGNNELIAECDGTPLIAYVRNDASFASNNVSDKKGTITGVMTVFDNKPQIYLRNETDVNFTEDATTCGGGTSGSAPLFFSEYAEGSSNNKYMEIYNPTSETVDLKDYAFPNVSNDPTVVGEYEFWNTFPDGATIAPGGVYIIAHPSANAEILAKANHKHQYVSNGDDGYALVYGTEANYTVLDWLGDWNGDPGSGWAVAGITNATQNHTLVRKASITKGNTDWAASAGTDADNSEWIVKDEDDFTSLGVR